MNPLSRLTSAAFRNLIRTPQRFVSAEVPKDVQGGVPETAEPEPLELDETGEQGTQRLKLPYHPSTFTAQKFDVYPYYVEREWWKPGNRMTFWATWRMRKDVWRRDCLKEYGPERMRLQALTYNNVLPQALRDECHHKLSKELPRYSIPALILNMCQFTGRRRGKIKPFRVNRHIFRYMADHSQLSGVKRGMW